MGVKPGYKQTEVGVIPEEWECSITDVTRELVLWACIDTLVTSKQQAFHMVPSNRSSLRRRLQFRMLWTIFTIEQRQKVDHNYRQSSWKRRSSLFAMSGSLGMYAIVRR